MGTATCGSLSETCTIFSRRLRISAAYSIRVPCWGRKITGSLAQVQPLLATALAKHAGDADLQAVGVAAQGIAAAADLLAGRYTLVTTNVPYLGRGKQADVVKKHLEDHYQEGKADLATAFVLTMPGVVPTRWQHRVGHAAELVVPDQLQETPRRHC